MRFGEKRTLWARILLRKLTVVQPVTKSLRILQKRRFIKSQPLGPIIYQLNPLHNLTLCSIIIYFNIILPCTLSSPDWSLLLKKLLRNPNAIYRKSKKVTDYYCRGLFTRNNIVIFMLIFKTVHAIWSQTRYSQLVATLHTLHTLLLTPESSIYFPDNT